MGTKPAIAVEDLGLTRIFEDDGELTEVQTGFEADEDTEFSPPELMHPERFFDDGEVATEVVVLEEHVEARRRFDRADTVVVQKVELESPRDRAERANTVALFGNTALKDEPTKLERLSVLRGDTSVDSWGGEENEPTRLDRIGAPRVDTSVDPWGEEENAEVLHFPVGVSMETYRDFVEDLEKTSEVSEEDIIEERPEEEEEKQQEAWTGSIEIDVDAFDVEFDDDDTKAESFNDVVSEGEEQGEESWLWSEQEAQKESCWFVEALVQRNGGNEESLEPAREGLASDQFGGQGLSIEIEERPGEEPERSSQKEKAEEERPAVGKEEDDQLGEGFNLYDDDWRTSWPDTAELDNWNEQQDPAAFEQLLEEAARYEESLDSFEPCEVVNVSSEEAESDGVTGEAADEEVIEDDVPRTREERREQWFRKHNIVLDDLEEDDPQVEEQLQDEEIPPTQQAEPYIQAEEEAEESAHEAVRPASMVGEGQEEEGPSEAEDYVDEEEDEEEYDYYQEQEQEVHRAEAQDEDELEDEPEPEGLQERIRRSIKDSTVAQVVLLALVGLFVFVAWGWAEEGGVGGESVVAESGPSPYANLAAGHQFPKYEVEGFEHGVAVESVERAIAKEKERKQETAAVSCTVGSDPGCEEYVPSDGEGLPVAKPGALYQPESGQFVKTGPVRQDVGPSSSKGVVVGGERRRASRTARRERRARYFAPGGLLKGAPTEKKKKEKLLGLEVGDRFKVKLQVGITTSNPKAVLATVAKKVTKNGRTILDKGDRLKGSISADDKRVDVRFHTVRRKGEVFSISAYAVEGDLPGIVARKREASLKTRSQSKALGGALRSVTREVGDAIAQTNVVGRIARDVAEDTVPETERDLAAETGFVLEVPKGRVFEVVVDEEPAK